MLNIRFFPLEARPYNATLEIFSSSILIGKIALSGAGVILVTDISLDPSEILMKVGETKPLTATITPENATDKTVEWNSDDPNVASIIDGVVTAHKAGTTTITATTSDGGKTADCMVTSISVTGVQDIETPLATIYPNPNNGQFTVVFAEDGANRISIANVSGTILISEIVTGTNCKIDISNYPQGIYFLSIVNGKRKTTVKILMSF